MKIIYMGTPDFALPALQMLAESGHEISLVVTKPDAEKNRGKKLSPCEVKELALKLGLPVESPEKIKKNDEFYEKLKSINPDLIVVAAYGKILPKRILDLPRLGCVNIHGSLLPKFRGAAPIQRSVLEDAGETGISLMYMSEGCDEGDVIDIVKTPIGRKTSEELFKELSELGAELLKKNLEKIEKGIATRTPQNHEEATFAPMISKEEAKIDFCKSARQIDCLIRGMNSWPSAYCSFKDQIMKVHKAEETHETTNEAPGTVIRADKNGLLVACGKGETILFKNIQIPGKKAMEVSAFLLGNRIEKDTILR